MDDTFCADTNRRSKGIACLSCTRSAEAAKSQHKLQRRLAGYMPSRTTVDAGTDGKHIQRNKSCRQVSVKELKYSSWSCYD